MTTIKEIGFENPFAVSESMYVTFAFEAMYSPDFRQIFLICRPLDSRFSDQIVVIIEPSDRTKLRVSFASQIVRPADMDTSSCVPVLRLSPLGNITEWRFVEFLSLLVRRKLSQWFKQTIGYEAVPNYGAIRRSTEELFTRRGDDEVVHYLFSDDLDLVGPRLGRKPGFLGRVWRQCRSFFCKDISRAVESPSCP